MFFVTWVAYRPSNGFWLNDQSTGFHKEEEAESEILRIYKDEPEAVAAFIVQHKDGKQVLTFVSTRNLDISGITYL